MIEVVVPTGNSARRGLEICGRTDLGTVAAKVEDLQSRTEAGRARIAATTAGVAIALAGVHGRGAPMRDFHVNLRILGGIPT
jgi:trimethylamine:corrinoid methyltransferase-like protein